ncbi:MAG TPA: trimeric intracellular cation channel family protein [Xanthomonadales bacterium]|nr:trimeric intracellular cation channel family protein [Xanthomonadales bacterium]
MNFIFGLEMLGTAAFAVTGALAASRKNMDVFGFCVLALMPAIGGGTVRDVIIDRTPVFWIADNRYVIVALVAALVVYFTTWKPGSRRRLLIWMDAIGLALFATLGTEISLAHNTGPLVAVMLGVTTAVTGGMIRDIICTEIPLVLSGEIYATAAFASSLTFVVADYVGLNESLALGLAVVIGFTIRALAIKFDWSLPKWGANR